MQNLLRSTWSQSLPSNIAIEMPCWPSVFAESSLLAANATFYLASVDKSLTEVQLLPPRAPPNFTFSVNVKVLKEISFGYLGG